MAEEIKETSEQRMKRLNVSDVPYMTHETEMIQKERTANVGKPLSAPEPKPVEVPKVEAPKA